MQRTILSLCDYSGEWSKPYLEAGYQVIQVDLGLPPGDCKDGDRTLIGADLLEWFPRLDLKPWGVLAAPPCTCFCRPGARWWGDMDSKGETQKAIQVFLKCYSICQMAQGWWALENPPGRFSRLVPSLPKPSWQFQPYEYGDPWSKQTYIWGTAKKPIPTNQVEPPPTRRTPNGRTQGRISMMSSSWKSEREKTPQGFSRAFFLANR